MTMIMDDAPTRRAVFRRQGQDWWRVHMQMLRICDIIRLGDCADEWRVEATPQQDAAGHWSVLATHITEAGCE